MRRFRSVALLAGLSIVLLAALPGGSAISADTRLPLSDASESEALVEIHLPDREAIDGLLELGVDLAEYRRDNADGTVTVNAIVTQTERAFLTARGYRFGATIEDHRTWQQRSREREEAIEAEQNSHAIAEDGLAADVVGIVPTFTPPTSDAASPSTAEAQDASQTAGPGEESPPGEVTIQRADYFQNRSGRFLSVEARTSQGTPSGGPTLSMSWAEEGGAYGTATSMSKFNDAGQYMYHRVLVRVGSASSTTPVPDMVRVGSSSGAFTEDHVKEWPGGQMPPHVDNYQSDFTTHYMDPVEVYDRINDLADEFPNISEIIDLPYQTEGYQRRAMGIIGSPDPATAPASAASAVLLISKAYGHEGGNDITVDVVPAAATGVSVAGSKITVSIVPGTTAAQVVQAINASPGASNLVTAHTYAGNAGTGPVVPQPNVVLDDLLNAPASVPRGPFQPQVMRIGKDRDGSQVGVFLYCQQHAREWATPLTCVETAEQLVRNYGIDPVVTELVDNLDIFILPSANPDGALYSMYDFNMQRKNMTRHCLLTASSGMPSSRNSWGVDLNRNNTVEPASMATRGRRAAARARRTPARGRRPSLRSGTSSTSWRRTTTSSSPTTSTATAGTSCGRPARTSRRGG